MIRKTFSNIGKISKGLNPVASTKLSQMGTNMFLKSTRSGVTACSMFTFPSVYRGFAAAQTNGHPVIELTSMEQWEELLSNGEQAYCIDFYADWCGPCRELVPLLIEKVEGLASNGKTPIILVKVNVDNFPEIAQALGVSTIPHVFLVKGGEAVFNFVGRKPADEIDAIFNKVLE